MKTQSAIRNPRSAIPSWLACCLCASAQTTAFTCQGRLTDGGRPANGRHDLRFTIYDSTNHIQEWARGSAIAGGAWNEIKTNGSFLTVHLLTNVLAGFIGGGVSNSVLAAAATIGGGFANRAIGDGSTVGGGGYTSASGIAIGNPAAGKMSTIGGGNNNTVADTAQFAIIPGVIPTSPRPRNTQ